MSARVLSWDWRGQIDLDDLAAAVRDLGGLHLIEVETGDDQYAIVLSTEPVSRSAANRMYAEATGEVEP
jgi:hypothetical protein